MIKPFKKKKMTSSCDIDRCIGYHFLFTDYLQMLKYFICRIFHLGFFLPVSLFAILIGVDFIRFEVIRFAV